MTWIDINDQLPDFEEPILTVDANGMVLSDFLFSITRFNGGRALFFHSNDPTFYGIPSREITHWMKIPPLPETKPISLT